LPVFFSRGPGASEGLKKINEETIFLKVPGPWGLSGEVFQRRLVALRERHSSPAGRDKSELASETRDLKGLAAGAADLGWGLKKYKN